MSQKQAIEKCVSIGKSCANSIGNFLHFTFGGDNYFTTIWLNVGTTV